MVSKKLLGYVLFGAGILVFALSYPVLRSYVGLKLPSAVPDIVLMVGGIALIFIGAYFAFKLAESQPAEVPIYHGKKIVGYRRMK